MRRILFIITLIISGEMVFGLPFHTARVFRPTFLEAFGLTNTQLGDAFAIYGITAMLSYFPGGAIADRFPPRLLLTASLFATAAGGFYMATFPGVVQLAVLYGYWGVTTIFLFWGALISATRQWGGNRTQGVAFGILDGGRGLTAALLAVVGVFILARVLPEGVEMSTESRLEGFRNVILMYTAATAAAGVLTWFVLPSQTNRGDAQSKWSISAMGVVMRRPVVWAHAVIIVCAYCGWKALDNTALYAAQVMQMDEVEAARFAAYASYLRPVAAVVAGILADRFLASRVIGVTFSFMLLTYTCLAIAAPVTTGMMFIYANVLISMFAVYALRGVYFALLQETRTEHHLTGTTVGMVSFVGYTPEIFFAPIGGRILDASPGLAGHQNYNMFLAGTAMIGLIFVFWLIRINRRAKPGSAR